MRKKPTMCAKKGFQGSAASRDAYWGPETDIEFCTPKGDGLAGLEGGAVGEDGRRRKPPAGSVDWTTGAPCVCTTYRDGATAEDMSKRTLPRKLPSTTASAAGHPVPLAPRRR